MEGRNTGVADNKMESYAKSRGFPSYAAMVAFYKHRSQPDADTSERPSVSLPMIHPKELLNYVLEKYRNATGT